MQKNNSLDNWRKEIDGVDDQIIFLLKKRIEIAKKIGEYKAANNLPARDEKRWHELLQNLTKKGELLGLSNAFITKLYNVIHEYTISIEKKIL